MATSTPAQPGGATAGPKPGTVALASYIGTTIEWYDFFIYGVAATLVFRTQFFPEFSETAGTLAALGTFAVGFIAPILGGGVTPLLATALFAEFGSSVAVSVLVAVVCLITLGAVLSANERILFAHEPAAPVGSLADESAR